MCVKGRLWLPQEDEEIVNLDRQLGAKRLARVLDRTPSAIHKRALFLNLTDREEWSRYEDLKVRLFYRLAKASQIAKQLPKRSVGAIHARAWRLGIAKGRKHWGDDDD